MPDRLEIDCTLSLLADPFPVGEIRWRAVNPAGQTCDGQPYPTVKAITARLDAVMNPGSWSYTYKRVGPGVVCTLRLLLDHEWCERAGVGMPAECGYGMDPFSLSFVQAARAWGIGAYLDDLGPWKCDYSQTLRKIVTPPSVEDLARVYRQRLE